MARVETVARPISPDELGITLPHEHLLVDFRFLAQEPEEASDKWIVDAPISIETLEMFQQRRDTSKDNMHLTDIKTAVTELGMFKHYGGQSVVEIAPIGCGRDPIELRKISEAAGVNIICATGWYTAITHPDYIKQKSIDELCSILITKLTEGIGEHQIKAGLIKCACSTLDPPRGE